MKTALSFSVSILLTLSLSVAANAKEVADKLPGVKIGAKAPDFELMNQMDKKTKLSELTKEGPVAVVFHRSANW